MIVIEFQNCRYLLQWGLTCLPFPQELGRISTAACSNEKAERYWCLNPEPSFVLPV